jgi:hypothetical protein
MAAAPSSSPPSVTLDASFLIGYCAKEPTKFARAQTELTRYSNDGWAFFAPGVILAESLFVLCKKLQDGSLTPVEHTQAVQSLEMILKAVKPPPGGKRPSSIVPSKSG